jgi:hypothetical protein
MKSDKDGGGETQLPTRVQNLRISLSPGLSGGGGGKAAEKRLL